MIFAIGRVCTKSQREKYRKWRQPVSELLKFIEVYILVVFSSLNYNNDLS